MMPFDPDAYLKAQPSFDPDAYLAASGEAAPATGFNPDAYLAAKPEASPSTMDYVAEIGKAFLKGGIEGSVATPLRGAAVQPPSTRVNPFAFSSGELELMDQDFRENLTREQIVGHPLYRAGEAVSGAVSKVLPERDIFPKVGGKDVVRDLSSGFGSVGGNIASTLLYPPLGITSMPLQGAGEATERAVKANATPEQIQRAGQLGNVAGATEFADALLPHLGSWGKVSGLMGKVGVNVLKGVFIEGGQEGLQQFIQNAIAKGVYKPEQALLEDVAYNAVIGAIVGGTVSGGTTRREAPSGAPSQEAIDAAVAPAGTAPNMPTAAQITTPEATPGAPAPIAAPAPAPPAPTAAPVQAPVEAPDPEVIRAEIDRLKELRNQYASQLEAGRTAQDARMIADAQTGLKHIEPTINRLEGMLPPPTPEEVNAKTFNPAVTADLHSKGLLIPTNVDQLTLDSLLTPTPKTMGPQFKTQDARLNAEETKVKGGINIQQVASIFGSSLYGDESETTNVAVKELMQNSFDAIKGVLEKRQMDEGNIDLKMDYRTRTVTIHDDGAGMTKEILEGPFFEIGGSHKETTRSSGGFGVAKLLPFYGNKGLVVRTMRYGKVHEIRTHGDEVHAMMTDKSRAPTIFTRDATEQDRREFPKGHGTHIEIIIPEKYIDHGSGETKNISFDNFAAYHPVLNSSPLFENINVTFNGNVLPIGKQFPIENFTQLANVNFEWGSARVYVTHTAEPSGKGRYNNVHVLSNGLYQFDSAIVKDPAKPYGDRVPYEFYIDLRIKPEVKAGKPGYPIAPNRQMFSPTGQKGFSNLFNYLSLVYQQAELSAQARNFGVMQYLDYDTERGAVTQSKMVKLEPKPGKTKNPLSDLKGGKVTVKDGLLVVNGRQIPDLTPSEIEKYKIDPNEIRVDQSEIDPTRIILHDNTDIIVSPSERRGMVEYGREKFGKRFDEYTFAMGKAFDELRHFVMRVMPPLPSPKTVSRPDTIPKTLDQMEDELNTMLGKPTPSMATSLKSNKNGYEGLADLGLGISLDSSYRGVHITGLPFNAMFLNPFLPEYTNNPIEAAVYMITTMLHEIAHYKIHNEEIGPELQRFITMLDTNTQGVDFRAFKQKVVNIVAAYEDVFKHMNGVFTSGDFNLQPRGQRFKNTGALEEGNGSLAEVVGELGLQSTSGEKLSDWDTASVAAAQGEPRRPGAALQTSANGDDRPSDNGRARNYAALRGVDPGISAPPQQPEVNILRDRVSGLMNSVGGIPSPEIKEAASHADRYNWFYKQLAGITQLLDGNPYFQPLRKYVERVRQMHSDEATIQDASLAFMRNDWRKLGSPMMRNLEGFIRDVEGMPYLSPAERTAGVTRQPTSAEFSALASRHKLNNEAINVYTKMRQQDATYMRLLAQEAKNNAARRIQDPVKLAARYDAIDAQVEEALARPFFPFTRFGRYYVVVKDAAGTVTHFETFEPRRLAGITTKRAEKYQMARKREIERKALPGQVVEAGVLPETAEPLVGLPTLLLQELLGEEVNFTQSQIDAIKLMQSSRNPVMGLRQRSSRPEGTVTGVSMELYRSYAKYYFFAGRYYAKIKHAWALKGHIAEAQLVPGNKAGLISSHMLDHMNNTVMDAKGDFGFWKGAVFLWAMGYSMSAATQNLSQTPLITYPFLAAKFGDIRAMKHVVKSMSDITNFYRRGRYLEPSPTTTLDFEMKALGYGIKTGRISETQAPELAGLAGGGRLISGMGSDTVIERGAAKFQEKAAWAFEMAEQFNRRVVYRAALRLAQENPNAKFVQESVQKYNGEFLLLQQGSATQPRFSEAEAKAIVTAIHSTDQTQFVYSKYARSKLFRGPKNIFFVFQQYLQSLLWMLGNNKSDVLPRYMVIMMLAGGLGGLPGYEDLAGLFRMIGVRWFGKDVNLNRLIRDHVMSMFDGRVAPDLVLHGLSRKGFGLPALADMMGSLFTSTPGRNFLAPGFEAAKNIPFPVLDRHAAISSGRILPVDLGKMFTPTDKLDKVVSEQAQRASGAFFSVGFNMYKSIMDSDSPASDQKRWEKAMPRALSSVSRSYRAFSEGRERGAAGGPNSASTVIGYDRRDTEQMLEALAIGLGYQPLRQSAKWDLIMAQAEASAFYDFRKKDLLEEYYEALKGRNPKEIEDVTAAIQKYNMELPDYAKANALSGETIRKSMTTRERTVIHRELGVPVQKSKIGISQEMQRLFPEATVDVRRVR